MKNLISATALFLFATTAFAQGIPVSASAVADDVSSPMVTSDAKDGRRPAPSLSDCCGVPVSAPQVAQDEDNSGNFAMAGLGFGLFGLMGVTKLARRKSKKSEGSGIA